MNETFFIAFKFVWFSLASVVLLLEQEIAIKVWGFDHLTRGPLVGPTKSKFYGTIT